jgi:hypothetical protein
MYRIENKTHGQIVNELTEYFDKRNLSPSSNLTFMLSNGFPEDLKEIDLNKEFKLKILPKHRNLFSNI